MDEVLKRRLIGALALMAVAFVLSLMLPKPVPGTAEESSGTRVVTLPLGPDGQIAPETAADSDRQADSSQQAVPRATGRALDMAISPETAADVAMDDATAEPEIQSSPAEEVPFESTEPPPLPADIPEPPAEVARPKAPAAKPEIKVESKPAPAAVVTAPKPQPKPFIPEPPKIVAAPAAKPEIKPADKVAEKKLESLPAKPVAKAETKPVEKIAEKKPETVPPKPVILPPKPPVPSAATLPPKPAAGWIVQAGAYADIQKAHQVEGRIRALGYAALISPAETASGILYRVRSGPYANRAQADAARAKFQQSGISANLVEGG